MVSCGSTFTVAGTTENVLYFWGTRFISPFTRPNTRDAFISQSFGGANNKTGGEEDLMGVAQGFGRRGRSESNASFIIEESNNSNGSNKDRALATLSSTELLNHQVSSNFIIIFYELRCCCSRVVAAA